MISHFPGIEYAAMPKAGGTTNPRALAQPPRMVVVHDTGNDSADRYDEAHFAVSRTDLQSRWTSAHAYIDRGGILGSLPLDLQAWAAYGYANAHGWHVEICRGDLTDPAALHYAAVFVAELAALGGIPLRHLTPTQIAAGERGICGHADITAAHIDANDHTDPSPFDWAAFMALVTGAAAPSEDDDMGASFGPVQLGLDQTSLSIPPVQAGIADPRRVWLNIGADTNGVDYALRIWGNNGDGAWFAVDNGDPGQAQRTDGLYRLRSGVTLSVELPKGLRLLTISRKAIQPGSGRVVEPVAGTLAPWSGSISACFERV